MSILGVLSACSSSVGAGGTTTLRFVASTTTQAGFAAEITRFEAANPKIKVQATYLPIEQVQTLVTTQLAARNGPDAFITNPGTGILGVQKLGKAGLLADLDASSWQSTVPAANLAMLQTGGKTYGYPSSEVLYFVSYNTSAFNQLGLTPPTTVAELEATCAAAKKAGKVAIALVGGATNLLALTTTQVAINNVYSTTPDWNAQRASNQTTFASSPGWQQTAAEFISLKNAGCFQKDAQGSQFADAVSLFTSGKALSMITFSTQLGQIAAKAPDLKYAAFALPAVTADQTRLPVATSVTVSANAKSSHVDAAKTFIDFLGKPAEAAAYAKVQGDVSLADAAKGVLPDYMSALKPLVSAGKTMALPIFVWPGKAYATLGQDAQGALTGQIDTARWLKDLDAAWSS